MFNLFLYVILLILLSFNICACFDQAWHTYQTNLKFVNREELLVTNVTVKENTQLPIDVIKWRSLSIGPENIAVGLWKSGLTIISATLNRNETNFDIKSQIEEFNFDLLDFTLFPHHENGEITPIVIVAVKDKPELLWYKIENLKLKKFWSWPLQKLVFSFSTFKIRNQYQLLMIHDGKDVRTDLYQFDIKSNKTDYWFLQSIQILNPTASVAVNNLKLDYYLSIPQSSVNKIFVYKYENNQFVHFGNLSSYNVRHVVSFEIGFKSFIAFDGFEAGIYQFTDHGLKLENILNSNLQGINYWFPIAIESYRDDVILLVQRLVDYTSHKSLQFDIITYNGYQFEDHEDIPCHYFGEEIGALQCLTSGIIGGTNLAIDDLLGIILPGKNTIFFINSEIVPLKNPLEEKLKELNDTRNKLQALMNGNEEMLNLLKNQYTSRESEETKLPPQQSKHQNKLLKFENPETVVEDIKSIGVRINSMLDTIKFIEEQEENTNHYDKITINGILELEGISKFNNIQIDTIKKERTEELLNDIVMRDNIKPIISNKTFTDIFIDDIYFDEINDIKSGDLIFKTNEPIVIDGDVFFEGMVNAQNIKLVSGEINDVFLKNEIVDVNEDFNNNLTFENLSVNYLDVKQVNDLSIQDNPEFTFENLTVTHINGEDLEFLLNDICFTNLKCYIPNLKVNGNIQVKNDVNIDFINTVKYPEEFILLNDRRHSNITGIKNFTSSLTVNEIRSRGDIDGVNTNDIITLTTDQNIGSDITFDDLEITETLHVNGNIVGDYIKKFVPNPTLLDVDEIKANVQFFNLEVKGNIFINDNFSEQPFQTVLEDLIYDDEENLTITSIKTFPEGLVVNNNLHVQSNAINNIDLSNFVTTDGDQILNMEILNGNIHFGNLHIKGLYGNINVTKLDQECVRISGEQFISSTLIFSDTLEVNNLEIVDKLNDLRYDEYLFTSSNHELNKLLEFQEIFVENLFVEGNFNGNITEFDLEVFKQRRLSLTEDQEIQNAFVINDAVIDNFDVELINGIDYKTLVQEDVIMENVNKMLTTGQAKIKNMNVDGSLLFRTVNNQTMDDVVQKILSNANAFMFQEELQFENNVFFDNIEIEKLSGVNFNYFLSNLIFKNESNPVINSTKQFVEGLTVDKLIETDKINGIALDDILIKYGDQKIKGPIVVNGDVFLERAMEVETVNDFNVSYIFDNFDVFNGSYIIKGEVMFNRMAYVIDLIVHGYTNDRPTQEFLDNVVYINGDYSFEHGVTFENFVDIQGNISLTKNFNNKEFATFIPRVVLTSKEVNIQSLISFTETVAIDKLLTIDTEFITTYLHGKNTSVWLENAIFLDTGLLLGNYTFEEMYIKDFLKTEYVNDMDMSFIIPLRENQTLDSLTFEEVTVINNVPVGNLVNGLKLLDEIDNTVTTDLDQEISSDVIFTNNVLIHQNLYGGKLNDLDVNKIVTPNTEQNLTASYRFQAKTTVDENLQINGNINGFRMEDWIEHGVKLHSSESQNVNDIWNVGNNIVFEDELYGDGLIGGLNMTDVMVNVDERSKYKYAIEDELIKDFKNICNDVEYLYRLTQKQTYKFEYFEELQILNLPDKIKNVHYIKGAKQHYLFITEIDKCFTHLLIFKYNQFYPVKNIEMGCVDQIIPVYVNDSIYLVVTSSFEANCEIKGTNIWKFEGFNIELLSVMENQELLQESMIPGTFYGMNRMGVSEYKIVSREIHIVNYRNWNVSGGNLAFVPRGLNTGLALRDGRTLFRLIQNGDIVDDENDIETEVTIKGQILSENNIYIPGKNDGEITVLSVGPTDIKRSMLGVIENKDTTIQKNRMDFIKIYDDVIEGNIFQKLLTYKPSSPISIDFGNGEALLVFLENARSLQVYEYKGIEGFKFRASAKISGTKLFLMELPMEPYLNSRKILGVINNNKILLLEAVMSGNKIRDDLHCEL